MGYVKCRKPQDKKEHMKSYKNPTASILKSIINSAGMTLIEVMAALALLSIVFAGFTMMVGSSAQMNIRASETRDNFQSKIQDIAMDDGLASEEDTISLKIQDNGETIHAQTISLNVTVKTTQKGGEPLAIIQ